MRQGSWDVPFRDVYKFIMRKIANIDLALSIKQNIFRNISQDFITKKNIAKIFILSQNVEFV